MTFAYWMVLVAVLLPYASVAFAKWHRDYDNHAPRAGIDNLSPLRRRAYWAHLNAFEAFAPFAASVVIAHLAHASQARIDFLAGGFIVARVAYLAFYLADMATARSLAWAAGFGCVIALFVVAA